MKRFTYKASLLGVLVLALVSFSACDITELNENPNSPTEPTLPFLLTNAQIDFADEYWGGFPNGRFGMLYAQYWSQTQYTQESQYGFAASRPGSVNAMWNTYYLVLNDLQEIIRRAQDDPEAASAYGDPANQMAIARIMQMYIFQVMTDIWGPIPFENSLQGRDNAAPAYSDPSVVYPAMIDSLDAAISMADPSGSALASGDLVYGGDMSQWVMFANSLKMRIAMRMADVMSGAAETAFEAAMDGAMESVDDAALIAFSGSSPYQNPFYENRIVSNRDDWAVSDRLVGLLSDLDDPRLGVYANPEVADGEGYVGFPFGLEQGQAIPIWSSGRFSRPGDRVYTTPDAPAILMLYDEVLFLNAEAAARGWIEGDADMYFEEAVAASMAYWGIDDGVDAYVSSLDDVTSSNFRQVIGEQKWIAQYMQGVQAWSEFRRLDFTGVLEPAESGAISDVSANGYALRLPYPRDEYNLNETNVNDGVSMLSGNDQQDTPLWWDVNPY